MAAGGIGGRGIEQGLVRHAGLHGLGEGVVDLEDGLFGAVVAVRWSRLCASRWGRSISSKIFLQQSPCFRFAAEAAAE